jgi:hypothetical protein
MDWDNEAKGKLDGQALKTILDLCDIRNEYIYIRTRQEFEHSIETFGDSDFGFLHISCHGNDQEICLTMDDINFEDLGMIMGPYLKYRRLFLSACKAACFSLAEHFIPRHHCYSIMGAADTIDYDKAAIFWSSYYYLIYRDNQERMWQRDIIPTLKNITRAFNESLNYFSIINEKYANSNVNLREIHFQNGEVIFDNVKKTRFQNLYWEEALLENDSGRGPIPPHSMHHS